MKITTGLSLCLTLSPIANLLNVHHRDTRRRVHFLDLFDCLGKRDFNTILPAQFDPGPGFVDQGQCPLPTLHPCRCRSRNVVVPDDGLKIDVDRKACSPDTLREKDVFPCHLWVELPHLKPWLWDFLEHLTTDKQA